MVFSLPYKVSDTKEGVSFAKGIVTLQTVRDSMFGLLDVHQVLLSFQKCWEITPEKKKNISAVTAVFFPPHRLLKAARIQIDFQSNDRESLGKMNNIRIKINIRSKSMNKSKYCPSFVFLIKMEQ